MMFLIATFCHAQSSAPVPRASLAQRILTWAVVYSKLPIRQLRQSLAGLLLLDPDAFSAADIKSLKKGNRLVFGYLSVGEAESYRSYYKNPEIKKLCIAENPEWKENFQVAFGNQLWVDTLASYSLEIMSKGFDGLSLDVVDAWEICPDPALAKKEMITLLTNLAKRIRARYPGVYLIFKNSDPLFKDPAIFSGFDGILQEGLYETWMDEKPDESWRLQKIKSLSQLRQKGKFIALLDYTRNPGRIQVIKGTALQQGFVPYFAEKNLDRLFPIP